MQAAPTCFSRSNAKCRTLSRSVQAPFTTELTAGPSTRVSVGAGMRDQTAQTLQASSSPAQQAPQHFHAGRSRTLSAHLLHKPLPVCRLVRLWLPVQGHRHRLGRCRHCRRIFRDCSVLRVSAGAAGTDCVASTADHACSCSRTGHCPRLQPPPIRPSCCLPSLHRHCYEIRCEARSSVIDGFDRSGVCKAGDASVVVRTVDNCKCAWGWWRGAGTWA